MKIKKLFPVAFGRFHLKQPIALGDGLNIVTGDNEAGKSTLLAFILGMLYGFKKEGKTRVSRSAEYDRYRPWAGREYRGVMVYEASGRLFRVERSFDPDTVRIYDDTTGEDITSQFSQDARKEYDFAYRHLGLSAREFRNTVWIGQLGSAQEPGLGAEIQGKIESILQGSADDVPLARALMVLGEERNKIKSQRSKKAKLDEIQQRISDLENELAVASRREDEVRQWMVEASELKKTRDELEVQAAALERDVRDIRYSLLCRVRDDVAKLEESANGLRAQIDALSWAGDLPDEIEEQYSACEREKKALAERIEQLLDEAARVEEKLNAVCGMLESLRDVEATGLDEAGVAALYSRYLSLKASATRAERAANEARRELRNIEEEGKSRGILDLKVDEEVLDKAEELHETYVFAERQRDQVNVEVEKARSEVLSVNPAGASAWLYGLALCILGIAIVLTVMGLPLSIPAFVLALCVFGLGVHRYRAITRQRTLGQKVLDEKEKQAKEQAARVEAARKALVEYLSLLGVSSIEELRETAREVEEYSQKLRLARDRYDVAHKNWFDATEDFSSVEKELIKLLRDTGCLQSGEAVTDSSIELLRRKFRDMSSLRREKEFLESRKAEIESRLRELNEKYHAACAAEQQLLAAAGVSEPSELEEKIRVEQHYSDLKQSLSAIEKEMAALMKGKTRQDLDEEIDALLSSGARKLAQDVTERDLEEKRKALDRVKRELSDVNSRLHAAESAARVRSEEGRAAAVIAEELDRTRVVAEELMEEYQALDLAYRTLDLLSRDLRREFAPALNQRVGQVLSGITLGKYVEVRISPDLEMSVIDPWSGRQVSIGELSGGAADQCYFALRLALAEVLSGTPDFPLFLDDSFVQYDEKRLRGVMRLLGDLSKGHQIVLFSCHGREVQVARDLGLEFNHVDLSAVTSG